MGFTLPSEITSGILLISLLLCFIVAAFLFVLLLSTKRKKFITVPLTQFLSLIVVFIGTIFTITSGSVIPLVVTLLLENVLLIPHYMGMKNHRLERDRRPKEEKVEIVEPVVVQEEVIEEETSKELPGMSLLTTSHEFVVQASEAFSEEAGLARLLDQINNGIIKETKADGGAILLVDDFDDVIAVKSYTGDFPPPYKLPDDVPHKIVRVETNFRFAQFSLDENIFGQVVKSGQAELITNGKEDSRLYENEPEDYLKLGSYIIIPLKLQDTVIGVIALARTHEKEPFTEYDFQAAQVLTNFACGAIKSVYSFQEVVEHADLTREAEIAGKLQITLHPKLLPNVPGLSLGSFYNTSEGVCGDYYDVLPSRVDRISFILADVAGKGMTSLVIMVMIRAIMRLIVNTTQSASTILSWVNRGIALESNIDHFASLALVNYDSTAKKIQYATAGSTPILYYNSKTDEITQISKVTEPIGVEKNTTYTDNELEVNSGDIIVMYSDGVAESVNIAGRQYSKNRLIQIVTENKNLSGKEIASLVKTDIKQFCGSVRQHDDQTVLIIKIQ